MPNEDHRTHAEVHANFIMSMLPDAQLEPEEMAQLAQPLQLLVAQLAGHMDYLQAAKEVVPEFEQYEKLVKRCNEVIIQRHAGLGSDATERRSGSPRRTYS